MTVYYALTTYHILCCVLHRLTRNRGGEAVLLLSDIHKNSVAFADRYRELKIFDEVYLLSESDVNGEVKYGERKHRTKNMILSIACGHIKKVLPVDLKKADEVYLCPDHFPLGWYVIKSKIKYHCFEEGCGVLSDNKFMMSNMSRNKTQTALMNTLGYFGSNDSCVEILADADAQIEGYSNPKMTDFSVKKILASLDKSELARVLGFFGVKRGEECGGCGGLILTQHMANLGIMSLEDQHLLYELFADYFLLDMKIAVKPHPDDIAGRYADIFGDGAAVLPFAMPSELLPYIFEDRLKVAIAANSTAVKSLGAFCDRMICFDNRILQDFRQINRYFAAAELLRYLGCCGKILTNSNEIFLAELLKNDKAEAEFVTDGNLFGGSLPAVVSDNLPETVTASDVCTALLSAKSRNPVIFLNETDLHAYFDGIHKEIFGFVRPIFIDKISRQSGKTDKTEVIYLYSQNPETLKKAEAFSLQKELKYTGVTLDLHSISKSEAEKIRLLEGVLAATEKRLNEYIENKKTADKSFGSPKGTR